MIEVGPLFNLGVVIVFTVPLGHFARRREPDLAEKIKWTGSLF